MVLVGEVQEPVREVLRFPRPARGQFPPQGQALADRHPVVPVAVDNQHRGDDVSYGPVRRVPLPHLGRHLAFPVPGGIGGVAEGIQVPQAGVGDDGTEPVRVARHPVGHVAAERPAHGDGAVLVDVVPGDDVVGQGHQVGERFRAPASPAALDVILAVSRGQRRIGQQHRPAPADQQPRAPAPAPRVPGTQRAAVDPQRQRRRAVAGRQQQVTGHARPVGGGGLDALQSAGQLRVVDGHRKFGGLPGGGVDGDDAARILVGRPNRVQSPAVLGDPHRGEGTLAGEAAHLPGGHFDGEHRGVAVLVGHGVKPPGIRAEGHRRTPAIPSRGQFPAFAVLPDQPQALHRGGFRGGADDAHARDQPAVAGDHRTGELVGVVGGDHPALPRRHVDDRHGQGHLRNSSGRGPACGESLAVGAQRQRRLLQGASHVPGQRFAAAVEVQDGESVRHGPQVVVPVPDRVAVVEDGGHLAFAAGLAFGGVGLVVRGADVGRGADDHRAGTGRGDDPAEPAGAARHRMGLPALGGQQPDHTVVLVRFRLVGAGHGSFRAEQEIPVRGEGAETLALLRTGQAPRGSLALGVEFPPRRPVAGAFPVPVGDGHQHPSLRGDRQRTQPRQAGVVAQITPCVGHFSSPILRSQLAAKSTQEATLTGSDSRSASHSSSAVDRP